MLFFADALPAYVQDANPAHLAAAHAATQDYWQSLESPSLTTDGITFVFRASNSSDPHPNPLPEGEGTVAAGFPEGEGMVAADFPEGEGTVTADFVGGVGIGSGTSNAPSPDTSNAPPNVDPPGISINLQEEGVDENGNWFQKLQVTLKPGGTLAEISDAIYGDGTHTDELFNIVKQQNPNIQRPQQLRVDDSIEIKVDPTATYVVKETQWDEAEGKLTNILFNGGKEITYPKVKGGTLRMIDFPADSRAQDYKIKIDDDLITVKPGSRLVVYAYRSGDTFQDVVKKIYGESSAHALQDFILQTKWTPDHWPPAATDTKRLIVSLTVSWDDKRPAATGFPEEQIVTNDSYRALMQKRSDTGIYPLLREGTGTLYRVEVVNPTLTAKDAAKLLYGSEDQYLSLAVQAGINPTPDATGKIPADFNPLLLGRRFDVYVDYTEEWFLQGNPTYDDKNKRTVTRLTNGTIFEEYDKARQHKDGVQRALYYPTGYKKIIYRPNEFAYSGLDFLFFINNGFKDDPNDEIDRQSSENFIASFFWNWAPGIPREQSDNPESFKVVDTEDGKQQIEIVIGPRPRTGLVPFLLYDIWLSNPFLSALGMVFLAIVVVFVLGMILRRRR